MALGKLLFTFDTRSERRKSDLGMRGFVHFLTPKIVRSNKLSKSNLLLSQISNVNEKLGL